MSEESQPRVEGEVTGQARIRQIPESVVAEVLKARNDLSFHQGWMQFFLGVLISSIVGLASGPEEPLGPQLAIAGSATASLIFYLLRRREAATLRKAEHKMMNPGTQTNVDLGFKYNLGHGSRRSRLSARLRRWWPWKR